MRGRGCHRSKLKELSFPPGKLAGDGTLVVLLLHNVRQRLFDAQSANEKGEQQEVADQSAEHCDTHEKAKINQRDEIRKGQR